MAKLSETTITDAVLERISSCPNSRLKQLAGGLIRHIHDYVREVQLAPEEWLYAIEFLTDVGKLCDGKRQEFILLSDTLGVSALVDILDNQGNPPATTESSLLGPFYRKGAPEMGSGASIAGDTAGEPLIVSGHVLGDGDRAIGGAMLDVWQAAPSGLYDLQDKRLDGMNLRGRFRTDAEGRFALRTVKPASYPVPADGPVGRMLRALGRHPFRPAHIHFIVSADGYQSLTTALYIAGDKYLESDAVFGSRPSLAVGYRHEAANGGAGKQTDAIEFDFVLNRALGMRR